MTNNLTEYDKETLFSEFQSFLKEKSKEKTIPLNILNKKLSPFETVVKFFVENEKRGYAEIGRILKKDRQVIWTTYQRAKKKYSKKFKEFDSKYFIPVEELFSDKFSVSEIIVAYLKSLNLKNSKIAKIMKRDPRTIWTLYNRYKKK